MKIESYSFGELIIDGEHYSSDLLICGEEIKSNWWRKEGHSLCRADLGWILKQNPELLIIGTGKSGVMTVPHSLEQELESNLDLIIERTGQAVQTFNQMSKKDLKLAAGFHLTC
ncbi:MAG: MTH938/NDUFAF3 family protein [Halanaerobacter sp.]